MAAAPEKKNFGILCDERGYLDQIEYIMQHGRTKGDRTGTGVISVFGAQARYSLRGLEVSLCLLSNVNMQSSGNKVTESIHRHINKSNKNTFKKEFCVQNMRRASA